ncbi:MAG: glycosyltransferase family 39 protein [Paludibacteraceae bacterium]|nr:glycosyltransferase family 39 protein [Paludibacteraceae bacterium]
MTATRTSHRFLLCLLLWGMLDLLCAALCEIHADEAYYRLYGQFLDWGYFDHPPMVALMTALGGTLIGGSSLTLKNLSVRLVTVLLHMATVALVWHTLDLPDRDDTRTQNRFLLLAGSAVMFCAYGFITAPDAPLLFFAALFYYAYRRFLDRRSWADTVCLGLSMAGMLYSKYMGVLVIALALVANPRLLRDAKAWLAVALAALLMTPHLYWQYSHHFPSFTYHLVDRATGYNPLFTLEYIPNQWAVFNPVIWVLMLWLGWRTLRSRDIWARTMGWTVWGFQLFFLVMTVRGHVEPHWTMVSSIPAIILLTEEWCRPTASSPFAHKPWRIALCSCFALVIAARIVLMANILPARTGLAGKQPYYASLHEQAQSLPVVFDGSFQRPSLYRFYYDDQAVLVRNDHDRYTQFDLLHLEQDLMGQPVCLMRHGTVTFVSSLTPDDLR